MLGPLVLPALLAAAPPAQAPCAAWMTLRTEHFRIHYPPPLAGWAHDLAGRIEAIDARVAAEVGHRFPGTVQVVLADPVAEANGEAVALLPSPYCVLWATGPRSDSQVGEAMASWTEELLAHELTHIHHLAWPREPRALLPPWFLPVGPVALKCPRWAVEGYATLLEGRVTGSGRPHGAYRAAVLRQWAAGGKAPAYRDLDRTGGFLGGAMAYLEGSAYLEWLERQRPDVPAILPRLWRRLASRRERFETAFAATFGFTAQDGYRAFQAELSHDALEQLARLRAQGLREGTLWLRTGGWVADLGVSPDGSRLLARLETPRNPGLRVWALDPPDQDAPPGPGGTPLEPATAAPCPRLLAKLPTLDHALPRDARWLDDRTVIFQVKRPDAEGILHPQAGVWHLDGGVDLDGPVPPDRSPILLPAHRAGRWDLDLDGQTVPLPGSAVGRAWVDPVHGRLFASCAVQGTWTLVLVPFHRERGALRFEPHRILTRSLAAAWNPAPTPDGRWLFFTALDPRGVEIRRLDLALPPLAEGPGPEPRIRVPGAVVPQPPGPDPLPEPVPAPEPVPYRAAGNLWNHPILGFVQAPSGTSLQVGAGGSDLLGRLSWQARISLGDAAGPRGAAFTLASAAWRWRPSLVAFTALERPSAQRLAAVAADRERRGAEVALGWDRGGPTRLWISPVAGWERDEQLGGPHSGRHASRGLAGLRAGWAGLRARGPWGLGWAPGAQAYLGRAAGPDGTGSWSAFRAALPLRLETPILDALLRGEAGRIQGGPGGTFRLGGTPSPLVPAGLDFDHLEQLGLPADLATGGRFLRWRAELGGTLHLYEEGAALWDAGRDRGPFLRVAGLEWAPGPLGPALRPAVHLRLGLHRPLDGPLRGRLQATLALRVGP